MASTNHTDHSHKHSPRHKPSAKHTSHKKEEAKKEVKEVRRAHVVNPVDLNQDIYLLDLVGL